ncbi:MAG: hypothetical protein ACE5OS_02705 [Anaerolineae bacterium]
MTPTPVPEVAAPSMTGFWLIVGFIGLITGEVSLKPYKLRRAGMRGAMTFDAMYSGKDKQAAIEYILDEQHLVVLDQERGEGDDDDAPD